ncbi:hypothetical protein AB8810_06965 [Xanthomonas sp. NCPPB 3005]|uniref:hypothetical protein n=1 Tax=Xanthomonas sp. NCPPB 3005 TaxID=3240913 RepID=UPI003515BE94
MSHSLDFVGLNERLFHLRHFVAGNKEFSRREQHYQGTKSEPSEDWANYASRLRYVISNELIEIAAKVRVVQDTAVSQLPSALLREMDQNAISPKGIGSVLNGDIALTLRESCNKIIHATTFALVFENARSTVPRYTYSFWNGICQLSGEQSKRHWRIALNVYRWADSLDCFLEELAGNVDW